MSIPPGIMMAKCGYPRESCMNVMLSNVVNWLALNLAPKSGTCSLKMVRFCHNNKISFNRMKTSFLKLFSFYDLGKENNET